MSKNTFKRAIGLANSGQRYPVMDLVRQDPGLAAVLSKLIPGQTPAQFTNDGNSRPPTPDMANLMTSSYETSQRINDAQTVMQILPDMELAAQILVSSIISPKDMTTTELTYSHAEGLLPPEVSGAMLARAKEHFEQVYKIEPLLPKILRDTLFETGSYVVAVIPENSIDDAINSSRRITLESLSEHIKNDGSIKPIGLLGPVIKNQPTTKRPTPGISTEAFEEFIPKKEVQDRVRLELSLNEPIDDTYLSVTDNPSLLKIPQINQKIREQRIINALGSRAMESIGTKLNDRELASLVYKDTQFGYKPISTLKTQEQLNRRTVGNPLILHLPSEAVIPVHVPGCPEEQIGFFVLIDADGNPVSKSSNANHYRELSSRLNSNGSFPSAMLNKVKGMMNGVNLNLRDQLDFSSRAYGEMVEQDLLARLRNGVYGNGVAIAKKEEVYRIMLARALSKQHTQLLFLPIELVTYFAFRYNDNGVGKSLLDDMQILNSLRSMLLFSNVMASLRNSIGRTEVKIKLDESDHDPKKTIELAIHEIMRTRQQAFPLGTNSPSDLVDWLQRAGYEFTFEGHSGLPDVQVDFGEKNSNYVKPDGDLEDSLRKRAIMAAGLSPETVDASFNAEFATAIVTNNILHTKRVIQHQDAFTPQLSDNCRKAMMNSEQLLLDLTKILENNFDKLNLEKHTAPATVDGSAAPLPKADQNIKAVDNKLQKQYIIERILTDFIMSFKVALPRPNSITLENQLAALETYTKALDVTLDAWISDRFFTADTGGDVASQVGVIREMLRAYFIRRWLSENGMMTELNSLTTLDGEGNPALDVFGIQKNHMEALTKSLTQLMVGLQTVKNASDTVMQARVGETEDTSSSDIEEDDNLEGGDTEGDELDNLTETPIDSDDEAPADNAESSEETPAEEPPEDNEEK